MKDRESQPETAVQMLVEVRREETLLKAGALQDAIFNSANFSSIATDEKGVIQIFNVGAERMLGYTAAEVLNKITPADISDPEELIARAKSLSAELGTTIKPGFEALVFKASRGIEDIYELTHIRKDQSRFPALVSVTALREAQGGIIGYLLIGTDNSARKQVEAERMLLDQRLRDQQFYTRSLIESTIDALMTTDPRGIITDVNKQMEALTGCTRDELIGAPFKDYFTDPERAEAGIKLVLSEGKVSNYELTARARDGKETAVSYNATTFHDRDRNLKGVFAAARDVTERQLFVQELQETNAELEKANVAKRDFLAVMSHEIRTPMNGILGMTELTLNTELTPSQRDYLGVVKNSAESLLKLLNDLLDFSKIEAGKLELECIEFDLHETLGNTVQSLATPAAQKGLELDLHIAPGVPDALVGDPHRLRQIVVNLVGNALKFTESGKISVLVESGGTFENQALVRFAVVDTGIGIPPWAHHSIFSAFEQADTSTTRRYGGTGLGLAITRQIVELMGGEIEVESELGRGSTFSFTARFGVQQDRHDLDPSASPGNSGTGSHRNHASATAIPSQRPLRILLAEDNAVNQRVAKVNLEAWGHTVTLANDGIVALAALELTPFDLILMDSQMPRMGGFEATAAIRAGERSKGGHVPIVAMTANVMTGFREECLAAGMDGYVAKPIRLDQLIAAMAEVVPDLLSGAPGLPVDSENSPDAACGIKKPFESEELMAGAGGDHALVEEMIQLCCEVDGPRLSRELALAVECGDLSAIEFAAHAMNGLFGEFHATKACELARSLEEAARQRLGDAVPELAAELEREFQGLVVALRIFLNESKKSAAALQNFPPQTTH